MKTFKKFISALLVMAIFTGCLTFSISALDIDTDGDGLINSADPHPFEWDVCGRDLAMFAFTVSQPGANHIGKMFTNKDIKPSDPATKTYFYNYASLDEFKNWTLVDSTEEYADIFKSATFVAHTYKNGNNVVIAIRGSDSETGEWIYNIVGSVMVNYHVEEKNAREYALKIADKYPDAKFYITGHSLGGYLAQFAAAELLENRPDINLAQVAEFNGLGLNSNPLLTVVNKKTVDILKNFGDDGKNGKLIHYHIIGDFASSMGKHYGKTESYYITDTIRIKVIDSAESNLFLEAFWRLASYVMDPLSSDDFAAQYKAYGAKSVVDCLTASHDIFNFLFYLKQGTRG